MSGRGPSGSAFGANSYFFVRLGDSRAGSSQTDPSLLAVLYDYVKLMPMMAEANQMSQELGKVTFRYAKMSRSSNNSSLFPRIVIRFAPACHLSMLQGVEFTLEIQNLALSDSKGLDLEKRIVVRVTAAEQKQAGPSALLCTSLLSCVSVVVR